MNPSLFDSVVLLAAAVTGTALLSVAGCGRHAGQFEGKRRQADQRGTNCPTGSEDGIRAPKIHRGGAGGVIRINQIG